MTELKNKFQKWTGQNLPKSQIKPPAPKTSPASQGSARLVDHLANIETPMLYDDGDSFCLVSNEDQTGVVFNACYAEHLETETRSVG